MQSHGFLIPLSFPRGDTAPQPQKRKVPTFSLGICNWPISDHLANLQRSLPNWGKCISRKPNLHLQGCLSCWKMELHNESCSWERSLLIVLVIKLQSLIRRSNCQDTDSHCLSIKTLIHDIDKIAMGKSSPCLGVSV